MRLKLGGTLHAANDLFDADPDRIWILKRIQIEMRQNMVHWEKEVRETYHDSHEFGVLYPAAEIAKLMWEGGPKVWKNISKQPRYGTVMAEIYTPFHGLINYETQKQNVFI